METDPTSGGGDSVVEGRLDVLSSVKMRVNRPDSRPDHCQSSGQYSHSDRDERVLISGEKDPDLDGRDCRPGQRRPQAEEDEEARDRTSQVRNCRCEPCRTLDVHRPAADEDSTRQDSLD